MKKKWLKVGLVIAVILIAVVIFFIINREPAQEPSPTPPPTGVNYQGVVPGESSKQDVREELGDPLEITDEDIFRYDSNNPNIPHQIHFANGEVDLIKEIIAPEDERTQEEIVSQYGEAPYVLYGPDSTFGFHLYVYPREGIAYIGHFEEPVLLEVWYFTPTSIENFKEKWAPEYDDTLNPQQ